MAMGGLNFLIDNGANVTKNAQEKKTFPSDKIKKQYNNNNSKNNSKIVNNNSKKKYKVKLN